MPDFIVNNSSISCIDLKINNILWPNNYSNANNNYLMYSSTKGLEWKPINLPVVNDNSSINNYLITNNTIGGSDVKLIPSTNEYLRAGLGSQTGGIDNAGTGLTYTSKGQITIGLTNSDITHSSGVFGSTMTPHLSLTHREVTIIDDKERISSVSGEIDYTRSLFTSSKLDSEGLKIRENGVWRKREDLLDSFSNKTLNDPIINGDLLFPDNYTNTSIGSNSGNYHKDPMYQEIEGVFKSHKNINDDHFEQTDGYYNNWEIETTTNDITTNNIIEDYTIGYSRLYGKFKDNKNNLKDNTENTFNKGNNYYLGWTITSKPQGETTEKEYTIIHSGIQKDTIVNGVTMDNGNWIMELSKSTENTIIKNGTTLHFTKTGEDDEEGVVSEDVNIGSNKISWPSGGDNIFVNNVVGYSVSISSITARYVNPSDDTRTYSITNEDNTYTYLTSEEDQEFHLSTQPSRKSLEGTLYGDKKGKITHILSDHRTYRLSMYHAQSSGYYIGWGIYMWDKYLFLNKNIKQNIQPRTSLIAKNISGTDEIELRTSPSGSIKTLAINDGGNYLTAPNITIDKSPYGTSFRATATCSLTNNSISSVNITYSGEGYTSPPTVTLTGGGGTGGGVIVSILEGDDGIPGTGYMNRIKLDKVPSKNLDNYIITSKTIEKGVKEVTQTSAGSGYDPGTTIIFEASSGTFIRQAIGTPVIGSGGEIASIIIVYKGEGYTEVPSITVEDPGGGGPGAAFTAVIETAEEATESTDALPQHTMISVPYGIIESYNSDKNEIDVLMNQGYFEETLDTEYLLTPNQMISNINCVSLNGYFNGWYIDIEQDKYFSKDTEPERYLIDQYNSCKEEPSIISFDNKAGLLAKDGYIRSITIENAGNNYSTPPTITFTESPLGSSFTATATCSLTNNSIGSVNITYSGEGYASSGDGSATITLSGGGGGSGAVLNATLDTVQSNGFPGLVLPSLGKPFISGFFKDWTIGLYVPVPPDDNDTIRPENLLVTNVDLYLGIINVSSASIPTGKINNGTIGQVDQNNDQVINLDNPTTDIIYDNSVLHFTDSKGTLKSARTIGDVNTGSSNITLIETHGLNPSENYIVSHLGDIDIEGIAWVDDRAPPNKLNSKTWFYLTYNNQVWRNTQYRQKTYRNIDAKLIKYFNNDTHPEKNKGFLKTGENNISSIAGHINNIQFFDDEDDGVYLREGEVVVGEEVFPEGSAPPSSINNYYNGWDISMKFSGGIKHRKITEYNGSEKKAYFSHIYRTDGDPIMKEGLRAPYILSKNLVSSGINELQDSIVPGSYITDITDINNDVSMGMEVTINNPLTADIPKSTILTFRPPYLFKKETTLLAWGGPSTFPDIKIDKPLVCDIYENTIIRATSTGESPSTVDLKVTSDVSADPDGGEVVLPVKLADGGNLEQSLADYTISVVGEEINIRTKEKSTPDPTNQTLKLIANNPDVPIPKGMIGWFIYINNDRKYRLNYGNYDGVMPSTHQLSNTSSIVNDFYKGWRIITDDNLSLRTDTIITGYSYDPITHYKVISGFPENDTTGGNSQSTRYLLIPSKNIKYGSNKDDPTDNTTKFKLIPPCSNIKETPFKEGCMVSEDKLPSDFSINNHFYNGWKIITYPMVISNDKIILIQSAGGDKIIALTNGYYNSKTLGEHLQYKLRALSGDNDYDVSYDYLTGKYTIEHTHSTNAIKFNFKWKTSQERYKCDTFKLFGFNNKDGQVESSTIISDNKVSLQAIHADCSIINRYHGATKVIDTSPFRYEKNTRAKSIITNERTQFQLIPPDTTRGKLDETGGIFRLEKDKCILINKYYDGWIIITICNGLRQFSYITEYNSTTREIKCPSLSPNDGDTMYSLSKVMHNQGKLRIGRVNTIPNSNKGSISILGFTHYEDNSSGNDDRSNDVAPLEIKIKLLGNYLSTIDDYYKDWKISFFILGKVYDTKVTKYYGNASHNDDQFTIEVEDINYTFFIEYSVTCEYILYEPQKILLSYDAIPIDNFYKGWTIKVKTNNRIQTSIISEYNGNTREAISKNITNILNHKSTYELIEPTEGTMVAQNQLSDRSSSINNYYKGWMINIINEDTNTITDEGEITSYNSDNTIVIDPEPSPAPPAGRRYKLYFNTHNTCIGHNNGSLNKTGSRNISIGSGAGTNVESPDLSNRLYIDSYNVGETSFIYGDMTPNNKTLKINAKLELESGVTIRDADAGAPEGTLRYSNSINKLQVKEGGSWKTIQTN